MTRTTHRLTYLAFAAAIASSLAYAGEPAPAEHWAFQKPVQSTVPDESDNSRVRNPIDAFTLAHMAEHGLEPSPEADGYTLIRRLYLDLIGLPPSPEKIQDFVSNADAKAYEQLVDDLLASPHYGERMAVDWLDAARYADTNGYEKDRHRSAWPWRDWVIDAFNRDLPYDRFIIEQLAGDLLPNATDDQRIATGFHRNSLLNEEGGVDAEEFRYEAVVDRVNTTATAFLGLTMSCAQCHDHKYDPISQREYFQFMAFLNNTDDVPLTIKPPDLAAKREQIRADIAEMEAALSHSYSTTAWEDDFGPAFWQEDDRRTALLADAFARWQTEVAERAADWEVARPVEMTSKNQATLVTLEDHSILAKGDNPNTDSYELSFFTDAKRITAIRLEVLPHPTLPGNGPGRGVIMAEGDFLLSEVALATAPWAMPEDLRQATLQNATEDYAFEERTAAHALDRKLDTGWSIKDMEGAPHAAVFELAEPVTHDGGALLKLRLDQYYVHNHTIGRLRVSVTGDTKPVVASGVPAPIESILLTPPETWSAEDRARVEDAFLQQTPHLENARAKIANKRESMPKFPTAQVLVERERPRTTRWRHRGEFLEPREAVSADVPAVLPPMPEHASRDRLALARWIASPENPLTARVHVNRLWQQFFGRGLVETPGDFGTRGARPTHPELLDWLAVELTRRGWSTKAIVRLIVTSAAYRQSARVAPEHLGADPDNRWLARAPRYRVKAETVRDIALTASGLLNREIGGPSVFPPLPDGVIDFVYSGSKWQKSEGADRYRRGLYTYWKRTLPYPMATTFDAPARDAACVRRVRSNTPLQALTLLNDSVFVEAARAMAVRVLNEGGSTLDDKIEYAFLLTLSRPPDNTERAESKRFLERTQNRIASKAPQTTDVLAGFAPNFETISTETAAAWTLFCRAMLNLDETITKG